MKLSSSTSLSFLFFLLGVTETAAWSMGNIFGNLLFALNIGKPVCNKGPLKPSFCDFCNTTSSTRRLDDADNADDSSTSSQSICDIYNGIKKEGCMSYMLANGCDSDTGSYSNYVASSVDGSSISTGSTKSTRMSFLPYIIAAAVATMFLGLFVWKKRRNQQAKEQDQLLSDDSFHGSVAKRISKLTSGKKAASVGQTGTETSFVKTTGYALA